MSHFNQIKNSKGNAELEQAYQQAVDMGLTGADENVPNNLCTSVSERPDLLSTLLDLTQGTLFDGQLPPTIKQMIAMTIAMQNDCRYCSVTHTGALQAMGVPENVIKSCASDPDFSELPPPQRAILKFALKAARDSQSIGKEDIQALRNLGLSDGEILEVIFMVGFSVFTELTSDITGVIVDGEEEKNVAV